MNSAYVSSASIASKSNASETASSSAYYMADAPRPLSAETLDQEAFWLLVGLLVAASLIVGCALYSLRITKRRLRNTASGRYFEGRDKQSTTLPLEDPRGECRYVVDGSCDADNPSSVDLTSTSGK